ncbi:MAG: glycoside hydrolase family 32 protein [Eubacteriales bacterium]
MSSINIKIEKDYLALPVSRFVGTRCVRILKDGKLLDDFTLRLDFVNPGHTSFCDVSAYKGQEITIEVSPDIELGRLGETQTDIPAAQPDCRFRPLVHFTTPYGWINDPNGLFVYTSPVTKKTSYHLFYQHNPYDWVWGNMHWGHAVSEDLLHWTHLGDALAPDENGTMFSGSAIVDYGNKSGLKKGDEDVILLFYTCAGNTSNRSSGKRFTQNIAYSTDGGMTFTKYEHNPVVPHIAADNRDPKVVWCDEIGKFLMAIYLDRNEYCLLTSDNLTSWEELQRISIDGDAECPDIYPINVSGTNERKWVFSGASHHYLVGEFVGGKFSTCEKSKVLSYGDSSYAAQTYSYTENARRIQFAWDRNTSFGDDPICGQMGIPCELTLVKEKGDYYLCANPAKECEKLYAGERKYDNVALSPDSPFSVPMEDCAYEICLGISAETVKSGACVTAELFGQRITLETAKNILHVFDKTMPLSISDSSVEIRLVVDKGTLEAFVSGGKAVMTVPWTLDFNQKNCIFSSDSDAEIEKLEIRKLVL